MNKFEQHQPLKATEGEWEKIFEEQKKIPESPKEAVLERNEITTKSLLHGGVSVTELVKLKDGGSGVFKPGSGEHPVGVAEGKVGTGYKRERAAYLVDLFLGLNIVPPTVVRTIEGEEGSLQEFVPNSKAGEEIGWEELQTEQFQEQGKRMILFDILIANTDRHGGNFLVDDNKKIWAIDHGKTFGKGYRHVGSYSSEEMRLHVADCSFSEEVIRALKELTGNSAKKDLLRKLLLELLEEREVEMFFRRLEVVVKNINEESGISTKDADRELRLIFRRLQGLLNL